MHEVILLEHEFLSIDIPCLTAAVNLVFELLLLIPITSGDIIETWIQILAHDCNRFWVCNLLYFLWNWSIQILKESDETTLLTDFLNNFEFKVIFLERKYVSCLTNLTVMDLFWNYKVVTCRSIIQHNDQGRPVQQGLCCTGSPCAEVFHKTECLPARVKMMDGRKEGHNEVLSHSWV